MNRYDFCFQLKFKWLLKRVSVINVSPLSDLSIKNLPLYYSSGDEFWYNITVTLLISIIKLNFYLSKLFYVSKGIRDFLLFRQFYSSWKFVFIWEFYWFKEILKVSPFRWTSYSSDCSSWRSVRLVLLRWK